MREERCEQPEAWRAWRRLTRHAAMGVAAIAVVAVSACASANPSAGGNPGPAPASSPHVTWYPAGGLSAASAGPATAPYFVTLAFGKLDVPAVVTDAVTGKVLGTVHPPAGGMRFVSAAAAGDDRTFILAAEGASPATRFYELRLGPGGEPRPLALLPVPAVAFGDELAVSADGLRLAIATGTAGNGHIEVVSLPTGTVRVWESSDRGSATSLSWAGDRWLAFDWSDASRAAQLARQRSGLRLLDTAAPGTDLMSSRLVVSQAARFGSFGGLTSPLITPDGSKVFATMVSGVPVNPMAEVVEFSARTGQASGAVTPPAGESGMGQWCGALWTDPSGQHLLAACGDVPPGGQGRIDNGHFTRMNLHVPTYNFSTPRESFIAW
jgi:hypothetical protein